VVYNRKGLAPWSLSREAGIESATVDGNIEVPQYVQPTIDTGFVDEEGFWRGNKSSDKDFIAFQTDEAIANGGTIITPSANADGTWPLDMTGYSDIIVAIKTNDAGNYSLTAVMASGGLSFANLSPVNASAPLRGLARTDQGGILDLLIDTSESLTADVWNIYMIQFALKNQKLLMFSITNNSGGTANIETAFMRLV